jgi:hypothetical protein
MFRNAGKSLQSIRKLLDPAETIEGGTCAEIRG